LYDEHGKETKMTRTEENIEDHDWIDALEEEVSSLEQQNAELKKLTGHFPNGMGDYELKIIENFNSKSYLINQQAQQIKELKEYPIYHKKECGLVDGMLSKNAHQRMVAHCTCGLDQALKDK